MKKKLLAGISVGIALCVGVAAVTLPAFIINSSVPSVSHAQAKKAHDDLIRGEAFYLQRIALPQHALLEVQLIDVTDKNNLPKVIAETKTKSNVQDRLAFNIPIKEDLFEDGHVYALLARITVGDDLWFVSDRTAFDINKIQKNYRVKLNSLRQNDEMALNQAKAQNELPAIDNIILNSIDTKKLKYVNLGDTKRLHAPY